MTNRYKGMKIIKILIAAIIVSFPAIAGALEVGFPEVGGYSPGESAGPAQWIKYIYLLSMGLVGLALIYTFARAGIEWMAGGANQSLVGTAKKRIWGGMIGLLILLGSYLFLKEINPQLVTISSPQIEAGDLGDTFGFFRGLFLPRNNNSSSADDQGNCDNNTTLCGEDSRCLNNITGAVVDKNVQAQGTCTRKRTLGEACTTSGTYNTKCFMGTCVDNVCTH